MRKSYGIDLSWDKPLIAKARCPQTGLDRYFNIVLDPKFLEIKELGKPKSLTEDDRNRLLAKVTDLQLWMELIPPENFEFQGFGVFKAVEVTAREMLSALQGAQGLKAMRITVNLQTSPARKKPLPEIVATAVKAMPRIANAPS
ncbi:MAG: hypothetical protein ACOZF2_04850 [Thermodesulfobacteriota bacterium]